MNNEMRIEVVAVKLTDNRGEKYIVKVDGKPVANYWTRSGADRKVASLQGAA